jgi:hypothetical protein
MELIRMYMMAVVSSDIEEEALVTEVADEVEVMEDEEDTACRKEIMYTASTTPVSQMRSTSMLCMELPRTEAAMLVTGENPMGNMIRTVTTSIPIGVQGC